MIVSTAGELMGAVAELGTLFPDWRIGQLIASLVTTAGGAGAIWDMEDERLLTAARRLIDENRRRSVTCAKPNAAAAHGGS